MHGYPSWLQRIPEMIEALGLIEAERIDRRVVERLFDLRRTAASELMRRLGAEQCGRCWIIGRGLLMARLREVQEHHEYQWETARRERVVRVIDEARRERRRAVVPVTAAELRRLGEITIDGLPKTVRIEPGQLRVSFDGMDDLLRQLMLLVQVIDNDFDAVARLITPVPRKGPVSAGTPLSGEMAV